MHEVGGDSLGLTVKAKENGWGTCASVVASVRPCACDRTTPTATCLDRRTAAPPSNTGSGPIVWVAVMVPLSAYRSKLTVSVRGDGVWTPAFAVRTNRCRSAGCADTTPAAPTTHPMIVATRSVRRRRPSAARPSPFATRVTVTPRPPRSRPPQSSAQPSRHSTGRGPTVWSPRGPLRR